MIYLNHVHAIYFISTLLQNSLSLFLPLLITETAALQLRVLFGEGQPCGQGLNRTEFPHFTAACSQQLIRPPPYSCSEN